LFQRKRTTTAEDQQSGSFFASAPCGLLYVYDNLVRYQSDSCPSCLAKLASPLLSNVNGHVKKAAKMLPFF
jgi:hypothetical protein